MYEKMKQTSFKLNKRDSVHFEDNTAPVNIAYAKEVCDVAILPLGAIEQHGAHCPNGMDSWDFFDFLLERANVVGTPVWPRRWLSAPVPPSCPALCTAAIPTCTWACLLPSL